MRAGLINTGTELLLGDVQDAHLAFIAREIFPLGLRIEERRTVPDTDAIRRTLAELLPRCEILFVTGGLGPTGDDITREMVADVLGLELRQDHELLSSLRQRLQLRRIKWAAGIARQADVPAGAQVLSNENGSAPGLYLKANINPRTPSRIFLSCQGRRASFSRCSANLSHPSCGRSYQVLPWRSASTKSLE